VATVKQRFWAKVIKKENGCWEWTGSHNRFGYGVVTVANIPHLAHRFGWMLTFGLIPDGSMLCHRCNNPPCVNPAHLYVGDAETNAADMMRAGRWRNGRMRLTAAQVSEIRSLVDQGLTKVEIAKMFGVTPPYVGQIAHGKRRTNR
jgi:hypothetical protein